MAAMPSPAASRSTSTGKCWVASHSRAYGARRLAANAAAFSVMTRSSSSRPKNCIDGLVHCRDDEFGAVLDAGRPPRGDGLDLGVELDRRRTVLVEITETGPFPATKRVVAHRDGNGHVDPDHADLHPGNEIARGVAVAGEDRHPVAVLVLASQTQSLVIVVGTDDAEHGTEDLIGVDRHIAGDMVEQRGPD